MCELCDLVNGDDGFILTLCNTCKIPLIVSRGHEPEFTFEEMVMIEKMFPDGEIRWGQRKIHDHAHAHLGGR